MTPNNRIKFMAKTAFIAALYTVLTWLCSLVGLSSGVIQLRLSEALIVMIVFTPAAVPGMTIGCLLSNLLTGAIPWDVVFGTLATLCAAFLTYLLKDIKFKGTETDVASTLPADAVNFVSYFVSS